jgi:molybdopterin-guanine dinucleotide biosynthesis protein
VEGFKLEPIPRIEIFRRTAGHSPIWTASDPDAHRFIAGVTDDDAYRQAVPFPTFDAEDPDLGDRLAQLVETRVMNRAT